MLKQQSTTKVLMTTCPSLPLRFDHMPSPWFVLELIHQAFC